MNHLRIIFMGTPDFAVPSLEALLQHGCNIVGVITSPDRPAGRGQKITASPVKQFALEKGLRILQPANLKSPEFLEELKSLKADLQIVVAFRMLPESVWAMPKLGTFNLHASLLPDYRGAAPINWAIINGEKETGVTTFFIQHEIDTGKIIFQEKIPIRDDENVGELYAELMQLGAKVLRKTVDAIAENNYPQIPQDHITDIKHAPKIFKETCKIDWNKSVEFNYNFIRGLSPYPGALTLLNGKVLKIYKAEKVNVSPSANNLTEFETDGKTYLHFKCNNGFVSVKECQLEGKKRMDVEEFLRGVKLS